MLQAAIYKVPFILGQRIRNSVEWFDNVAVVVSFLSCIQAKRRQLICILPAKGRHVDSVFTLTSDSIQISHSWLLDLENVGVADRILFLYLVCKPNHKFSRINRRFIAAISALRLLGHRTVFISVARCCCTWRCGGCRWNLFPFIYKSYEFCHLVLHK